MKYLFLKVNSAKYVRSYVGYNKWYALPIPQSRTGLLGLEQDMWAQKTENTLGDHLKWLKKLHGLSPQANYTDRATAACRRSNCQLLRIESATWSAWRIPTAVFSIF
jgi:hypothetical protein